MPSCTFYINKSDHRKITKDIEQIGTTQDILFKDTTDMMNPVLMMRSSDRFDINANYCYLDQTGKYYYINDCEYSNGYYLLHLHVDVLMTYQNAILAQSAIVKRSNSLYNIYQEDEKFKVYNYTVQRHLDFHGGFDANTQNFLLTVVGKTTSIID